LAAKLRWPPVCAGCLLIFVAGLDLFGWFQRVSWLVRVGEETTAMNPLTAACFTLLGLSLIFAACSEKTRRAGQVLCAFVVLAGLARVLAYLMGSPFMLDQVLFRNQLLSEATPNQMAWSTACCFVVLALGCIFAVRKERFSPYIAQSCAGVAGAMSMFVVSTYVFRAVSDTSELIPMALNTAILFVATTGALIYLTSLEGFLKSMAGASLRARAAKWLVTFSFAVPLLLALIVERYQALGLLTMALGEAIVVTVTTAAFVGMVCLKSHYLWRAEMRVTQAEKNIQRLAEYLSRIIDAVPNFIFVKDRDGVFQLANAACAEVYGRAPHELVGKSDADFCDRSDELNFFLEKDREVLDNLVPIEIQQEKITDASGNVRWLQTAKVPIPALEGQGMNLLGVSTDITWRVVAEQEARSAAKIAQDLYDHAPCGYHSLGPDGTIVGINETELEWLGYERDEVVGKLKMADLLGEERKEHFEAGFLQLMKLGHVNGVETELRRKDGTSFAAMINSTGIYDASGGFLECRTTVFDICDRKAAENEALMAKAESERANLAKSQFLSRMSHELRTPLNSILGFSQLLELKGLGQKEQECVSQILRGGKHLLQLINEVLDIARIESGDLSISIEPVPLAGILEEAISLVGPIADASKVTLALESSVEPDVYVFGDKQRLLQVMLNLLSNSVKYNNAGGKVVISVNTDHEDSIDIRVTDWGIGIDPDQASGLFEAFDRLGAQHTGIEGTGLGLALSKGLATHMKGDLTYEPNVEGGSVFIVTLRRAQMPVLGSAFGGAEAGAHAVDASRISTVLMVEDNRANIELVVQILACRPNIKLISAMTGRLAIDLARENRPDLIVLDLNLPDVNGEEVLVQLRNTPATRDVPVLVSSAEVTPKNIDRLMGKGATGYVTKPLEIAKFLSVVDGILGEEKKSA